MDFTDEMAWIESPEFVLGEYIYMGMAKLKEKTVCVSIGYKIDYCYKKGKQFAKLCTDLNFYKINKVRVGELEQCEEFYLN
jgi:hypothetical protein